MITTEHISEFEWITEVPMYIVLEPRTLYYFEPRITGNELEMLVERINPTDMVGDDVFEWLMGFCEGDVIKYFAVTGTMELDGWCDETSIDEAKDVWYPNYNYVDGRTL